MAEHVHGTNSKQWQALPTLLQLPQAVGTPPVNVLYAMLAYSISEKELQDDGKDPCSLLLLSLKTAKYFCN